MRKRRFIEYDRKGCIRNNIKIMSIFIGSLIAISTLVLGFLWILYGKVSSIFEEAGKMDTEGGAMTFFIMLLLFIAGIFIGIFKGMIIGSIMTIFIMHAIIISLFIRLHEKLVDNIRASIGLIICNIVVAVILQSFVYCNGILYFFISLIAIAITFMIRYIGIIIKNPQKSF